MDLEDALLAQEGLSLVTTLREEGGSEEAWDVVHVSDNLCRLLKRPLSSLAGQSLFKVFTRC